MRVPDRYGAASYSDKDLGMCREGGGDGGVARSRAEWCDRLMPGKRRKGSLDALCRLMTFSD